MLLKIWFQTAQNFHGIFDGRFIDVNFLESTAQRAVFFEMLAEFLVGGGAHATQFAALKRRFQKVGGVHRTARGGASTDDRVNLVDEQHCVVVIFHFGHDGLQAFFEITAIARAGQQCAHVEGINGCIGQDIRCLTSCDFVSQAFGYSGFTNTGITYQKRVVFAPATEHLNAAFHLMRSANQRIDVTLGGFRIQINAVLGKCAFLFLNAVILNGFGVFVSCALDWAGFAKCRVFRYAMCDEIHSVIARHVLFLQEVGRVGLTFRKNRDENVCSCHFCPT